MHMQGLVSLVVVLVVGCNTFVGVGSQSIPLSVLNSFQFNGVRTTTAPITCPSACPINGRPSLGFDTINLGILSADQLTYSASFVQQPYSNDYIHYIGIQGADFVFPNPVAAVIRIRFTSFNTEALNDILSIYYTDSNGASINLATLSGPSLPAVISTPIKVNSLVLIFTTSCKNTGNGFAFNVCMDKGGVACTP